MDKKIWAALAILVVLAVGAWVITSSKSDTNKTDEGTSQTQSTDTTPTNSGSSQSNDASSEQTNKVDITNFSFSPSSLTVKVGDTVTWENMDSTAHTVTGVSADGPNSGTLQKGQSYSFQFTKAGTYKYACKFHPSMTGTITVQ